MQQLSLALERSAPEESGKQWFQTLLSTLGVVQEPGWPDHFGRSLRQYLQQQELTPIKTLSLFSGGGGLDIAFHDAGFEIIQMVELEPKYVQTLQQNSQPGKWLNGSEALCIDIRHYSPAPDRNIDFIIGGPPCQSFSAAGRRAAGVSGTTDSRGTLFQEYVRILELLQPKGFLFENVYGITGANGGEDWQSIQSAFREVGYHIYSRILDAADYGVPQHRERLFIVGLKQGEYCFPYPTHGLDSLDRQPYYSAAMAVNGVDSSEVEPGLGGKFGHLLEDIPPGLNYSFYTKEMGYPNPVFSWRSKFSDFLYKADPDMPVRTIKARGGQYTGPFSWENRKFSIPELKRLQTIPDDYEIVGNRQIAIEQIGNSVPPQLGRVLALSVLEQVFGINLPFEVAYLSHDKKLGFRQRKRNLTKTYQQKARVAIAKLRKQGKIQTSDSSSYEENRKVVRFLSNDFHWSERPVARSEKIYVNYELNPDCWVIAASNVDNNWDQLNQFCIHIQPSFDYEDWVLGTKSVNLSAKQLDPQILIALWKSFEEKLYEVTGKADLVQLSGYYQYTPRIRGTMHFCDGLEIDPIWQVIQFVTKGIGTASQLTLRELEILWDIDVNQILFYLKSLRNIGYEVRSHNTNPQIPEGEYLIPYAFPTLNPKSVQLRKML
jgi:DNA (cytosine-5)-methyltransferase 1